MKIWDCLCEFINFLYKVNSKKPSENVNPTFSCGEINISIVMIGKEETMQSSRIGYEPYVNYIRQAAKNGVKVFYILARNRVNCFTAECVIEEVTKENIVKQTDKYVDEILYQGKPIKVLCARLENTYNSYNPIKRYLEC